jgi:hypothetical protein
MVSYIAQFLLYWQISISNFIHDFMSEASLYFAQSTEARYDLINHICLDTCNLNKDLSLFSLNFSEILMFLNICLQRSSIGLANLHPLHAVI